MPKAPTQHRPPNSTKSAPAYGTPSCARGHRLVIIAGTLFLIQPLMQTLCRVSNPRGLYFHVRRLTRAARPLARQHLPLAGAANVGARVWEIKLWSTCKYSPCHIWPAALHGAHRQKGVSELLSPPSRLRWYDISIGARSPWAALLFLQVAAPNSRKRVRACSVFERN